MFGFFKDKRDYSHGLDNAEAIQRLINSCGVEQAGIVIKNAANDGNVFCQIFLSGAGLYIPIKDRSEQVKKDTEHYTKLAAESGDPGSQFNLAKLYLNEVDVGKKYWSHNDLEIFEKVKFWHGKAAAQGFKPSINVLEDFKKSGL